MVREFACRLRNQFAPEIEREARDFKRLVLKDELPPSPGRPRAVIVTRAAELRAQGKTRQQIYTDCRRDYLSDQKGGTHTGPRKH
jgi:hypothetical protein